MKRKKKTPGQMVSLRIETKNCGNNPIEFVIFQHYLTLRDKNNGYINQFIVEVKNFLQIQKDAILRIKAMNNNKEKEEFDFKLLKLEDFLVYKEDSKFYLDSELFPGIHDPKKKTFTTEESVKNAIDYFLAHISFLFQPVTSN